MGNTQTQGKASLRPSQWEAPGCHSEQPFWKPSLSPEGGCEVSRGSQKPAPSSGRAGHGSPKARRRAGKGGQLGGHLPHMPLFSFSAKKEQRCPLGSGQSLPSQPSSHLLQSPEDEPSQARQAPRPTRHSRAGSGGDAGDPARPDRKPPQRPRQRREEPSRSRSQ